MEEKGSTVPHLLSFVANSEGTMVSIHMNLDGLSFLLDRLSRLKVLVENGHCEDTHWFTADSIGNELSSTKLAGVPEEDHIVHHVKLYCWTKEWAEAHGLFPAI